MKTPPGYKNQLLENDQFGFGGGGIKKALGVGLRHPPQKIVPCSSYSVATCIKHEEQEDLDDAFRQRGDFSQELAVVEVRARVDAEDDDHEHLVLCLAMQSE